MVQLRALSLLAAVAGAPNPRGPAGTQFPRRLGVSPRLVFDAAVIPPLRDLK